MLAGACVLVDRFQTMIRKKAASDLELWIAESKQGLMASFATGIANDKAAVHAAIMQPWSNGQVEAQITKLKLVKRQMYGRAKLDLLQARLVGAAHDHRICVRAPIQCRLTNKTSLVISCQTNQRQ